MCLAVCCRLCEAGGRTEFMALDQILLSHMVLHAAKQELPYGVTDLKHAIRDGRVVRNPTFVEITSSIMELCPESLVETRMSALAKASGGQVDKHAGIVGGKLTPAALRCMLTKVDPACTDAKNIAKELADGGATAVFCTSAATLNCCATNYHERAPRLTDALSAQGARLPC